MKTSHAISYSKLETILFKSGATLNCALNSLLSSIILESLAGAPRQKKDIKVVKITQIISKMWQYTHTHIGDPQNSVIKLLEVINNISNAISIYKTH